MSKNTGSIGDAGEGAPGYFADYRKTVVRRVAAVEVQTSQRDSFSSKIAERRLGPLRLFAIQSDAVSIKRSRRCISADQTNQYIVALNTAGNCLVQHGHTILPVPANAFYLLDKTQPYETVFPGQSSRILICVPRPLLDQRIADPCQFLACFAQADVGTSRITADFIASLFQEAGQLDTRGQHQIAQMCLDLLSVVLSSNGSTTAEAVSPDGSGRRALRSRIKAHVRYHLGDPELGPASICEAMAISKRYLHQLFSETDSSVCAWIREQRLNQSQAMLRNPHLLHMSITQVGFDCGFSDSAHFSRLFKARFGIAPSRFRAESAHA